MRVTIAVSQAARECKFRAFHLRSDRMRAVVIAIKKRRAHDYCTSAREEMKEEGKKSATLRFAWPTPRFIWDSRKCKLAAKVRLGVAPC